MVYLDSACSIVASQLESFGLENDMRVTERSQRMLNLERPTAELLYILMTISKRCRILEIGTSNG